MIALIITKPQFSPVSAKYDCAKISTVCQTWPLHIFKGMSKLTLTYTQRYVKQNRESTEGYSRRKVEKRRGKIGKSGFNNWSISMSQKGGRKGKLSLLACHTRCKCSIETTRNSVKVKRSIKIIKLVESMIGWEVTVTGKG